MPIFAHDQTIAHASLLLSQSNRLTITTRRPLVGDHQKSFVRRDRFFNATGGAD
jgi:hypothetical protein